MLDFFDFFLIGYVLAFIVGPWHLTFGQSAMVLVASGLGAVPGAFFWGWMGDRIGRRTVFMATAVNVALATGAMAFTPDQDGWISGWIFLSVFRFVVGFGNAGLIAVDIPLVQEFVPASKRGWVAGLTTALLPAGNLLGALAGAYFGAHHRLAWSVPGRPTAHRASAYDPLLGARITALAHARGTKGGRTQIARLGAANRPAEY
jgi:putative MFS transporter